MYAESCANSRSHVMARAFLKNTQPTAISLLPRSRFQQKAIQFADVTFQTNFIRCVLFSSIRYKCVNMLPSFFACISSIASRRKGKLRRATGVNWFPLYCTPLSAQIGNEQFKGCHLRRYLLSRRSFGKLIPPAMYWYWCFCFGAGTSVCIRRIVGKTRKQGEMCGSTVTWMHFYVLLQIIICKSEAAPALAVTSPYRSSKRHRATTCKISNIGTSKSRLKSCSFSVWGYETFLLIRGMFFK